MTFQEKETVIRACAAYRDQQTRAATRYRKQGEAGRAAMATAEAGKAQAMVFAFCEILNAPAGTVTI